MAMGRVNRTISRVEWGRPRILWYDTLLEKWAMSDRWLDNPVIVPACGLAEIHA
jgi:hypothetical protein